MQGCYGIVATLLLAIEDRQGMMMVDLGLKSKTLNNAKLRSCCARLLCFCGKNVGLIKLASLNLHG